MMHVQEEMDVYEMYASQAYRAQLKAAHEADIKAFRATVCVLAVLISAVVWAMLTL